MFALSVRQPWPWAMLHAGKDIENRSWHTKFRGPVLIHAAKGMTQDECLDAFAFMRGTGIEWKPTGSGVLAPAGWPGIANLPRGGVVGCTRIVDCVVTSKSPWFNGMGYGFVLADTRPVPFVPCKGALGFFKVGDDVVRALEAAGAKLP